MCFKNKKRLENKKNVKNVEKRDQNKKNVKTFFTSMVDTCYPTQGFCGDTLITQQCQ